MINNLEMIKRSMALRNRTIVIKDIDENMLMEFDYLINKIVDIDNQVEEKLGDKIELEPIHIHIDSYGGCLYSTLSIISTIESLKKKGYKIVTYSKGKSMSGGFFILISGSERLAQPYSKLMLHDQRNFQYGTSTHDDKRRDYEESQNNLKILKDVVSKYTDIPMDLFDDKINRKDDWYMSPDEALKYGVIDKVE